MDGCTTQRSRWRINEDEKRLSCIQRLLGSGKTSMMITLLKELEARGLPAATISNDLGARGFVDTYYSKACGCDATELSGACICYQTENLVDRLRRVLESEGHAVAMSDIPGFGVGALEHVYHKLNERYPNEFTLLPFTAVTDLRCVRQLQTGTANIPRSCSTSSTASSTRRRSFC